MNLTENEINTGIIIKALYENVQKGVTSYTIHPMWQAIIDNNRLIIYEAAGLIESNENVLNLTSKGLVELNTLFHENKLIPVTELIYKVYEDAKKIVTHFNRFANSDQEHI
ncbi:hypothetical protein [Lysinibacillus sphaericus]|uniref:hypothetical protein n=1 Tax=Lysinibacillus sphaericus TaxID=1421 RepID=UPI0019D55970|nr:hypothetical protein [Lysinibacillus sphaericus]